MKPTTVLVLGATGKTGSRVIAKLSKLQVATRAGSRQADIPFDWEDQSTWVSVLADIDKVYVTFQPDLAIPGAAETIKRFSAMASHAGVKNLVLLSGRGEPEAVACEQAVIQSGIPWTIVRASWFFQNFSESIMLEPVRAGIVAIPNADVPEPFIDADDIADVVVAALTDSQHHGQLHEVTGPRLLTFREAVTEIARATGREIAVHNISLDEYKLMLEKEQVPAEYISLLLYLFSTVLDGRNSNVCDGVKCALNRTARDFSDYVQDTVPTGVWNIA